MKTIQMTIDEPLLEEVDQAATREKMARSAFIRIALIRELRRRREASLDRQHEAAYRLHPQTCEEVEEWDSERVWGDE